MSKLENEEQPRFTLQRIYVKDLSFESPKAPGMFKNTWKPELKLDLNTEHHKLGDDMYEVVLSMSVTATNEEKGEKEVCFLVEVQQAGIFLINGLEDKELHRTLRAFCPNILFPYAREVVDNVVIRGSFPPVMLSPVNFDALYAQVKEAEEGRKTKQQVH